MGSSSHRLEVLGPSCGVLAGLLEVEGWETGQQRECLHPGVPARSITRWEAPYTRAQPGPLPQFPPASSPPFLSPDLDSLPASEDFLGFS